jgi:sulfur carrier protein
MSTAITAPVIYVNDQPRLLAAPTTLLALLNELGHAGRKGVAVALNGVVVPRVEWPARSLADADHVLIIQATQGG